MYNPEVGPKVEAKVGAKQSKKPPQKCFFKELIADIGCCFQIFII